MAGGTLDAVLRAALSAEPGARAAGEKVPWRAGARHAGVAEADLGSVTSALEALVVGGASVGDADGASAAAAWLGRERGVAPARGGAGASGELRCLAEALARRKALSGRAGMLQREAATQRERRAASARRAAAGTAQQPALVCLGRADAAQRGAAEAARCAARAARELKQAAAEQDAAAKAAAEALGEKAPRDAASREAVDALAAAAAAERGADAGEEVVAAAKKLFDAARAAAQKEREASGPALGALDAEAEAKRVAAAADAAACADIIAQRRADVERIAGAWAAAERTPALERHAAAIAEHLPTLDSLGRLAQQHAARRPQAPAARLAPLPALPEDLVGHCSAAGEAEAESPPGVDELRALVTASAALLAEERARNRAALGQAAKPLKDRGLLVVGL